MEGTLGTRIKALRNEKDITLAALGEKLDLSTSYLSQIERDRINPSLTTLMNISRILDVDPRDFFETDSDTTLVTRSSQEAEPEYLNPELAQFPLSPPEMTNRLHVYRIELHPNSMPISFDTYNGEELCFILTGVLTVINGDETHVLRDGDSIHYDTRLPHCWSNQGNQICKLIWGRARYLDKVALIGER